MSTQWMKYDMNTLKWTHIPINHSSMNSTVTVNKFGLLIHSLSAKYIQ